jgi:hypothetical protein
VNHVVADSPEIFALIATAFPRASLASGVAVSTRAFLPTAVAAMTAAAAPALSRLTCSPSSSADQPSVSAPRALL